MQNEAKALYCWIFLLNSNTCNYAQNLHVSIICNLKHKNHLLFHVLCFPLHLGMEGKQYLKIVD